MKGQFQPWSPSLRYVAFGVVFILLAVGLWAIRSILTPIIIAAFIAYLIHPAVNLLTQRTRMSRRGAVILVYFVTLAVLIGTPSTLTPLFFDQIKVEIAEVQTITNPIIAWLSNPNPIPGIPLNLEGLAAQIIQFRSTFVTSLQGQALQLLGKTSLGALWLLVILAAVYYFLAEWPRLRNGFIGSFPYQYRAELDELYQRLSSIWMAYLRGQLLLMLIVGVTFTIAWTIIGIPGALILGVIAGFLTLIPDVGPFLAAMLAVAIALLEGSNWSWMPASTLIVALITLATYILLISIKNIWLRPYIMGRSVHMHEALVLITIILSTILWGIMGALLVVPVLASLGIIFDYLRRRIMGMAPFPPTEPFVLETPQVSGTEKVAALKSKISRKKKG